jgi:hypothetical protein
LQQSAILHLLSDDLFVPFYNQSLVLGRNPREDFDSVVKEVRRMPFDETVIDGVDHVGASLRPFKLEVIDLPFHLTDLSVLIFAQFGYVLSVFRFFFSFDNDHLHLFLDHSREEGSLDS